MLQDNQSAVMTDCFGIFHIIYGTSRPQKSTYKQVRQLTKNILTFRNLLANADYSTVLSTAGANKTYDNFMLIYTLF